MVENLCQGAQEDTTDFMIRVGTSVSNLGKDWQGQLTQEELESLQYEVSLNGVREEIWHVLDSEIVRRGQLTPHQMYEAVKKYETYVAHKKRLEGRVSNPSAISSKGTGHATNYKPHFHKTTVFAATVEEPEDDVIPPESSFTEEADSKDMQPTQGEEGLYIPPAPSSLLNCSCKAENLFWSSQRACLQFSHSNLLHAITISLASVTLTHRTLQVVGHPIHVRMA